MDHRSSLRFLAEATIREVTGASRVSRLCPHCGSSEHGQPRLPGSTTNVSIAYADRLVAVAWGTGPVGVDIERGDHLEWTRVEALAKAAGTGLRDWPDVVLPQLATRTLTLPKGYVGTVAGDAQVRLAGPAAPAAPSA